MSYKNPRRAGDLPYVVCPLCGRNRILETERKGRIRWDFWDPETSPLIQIREAVGKLPSTEQPADQPRTRGGAKAGGIRTKAEVTWDEAAEMSEYEDQIAAIVEQLKVLQKLIDSH